MIGGGVLPLSESGLALLLGTDELPGVFLSLWAGGACGILERTLSLLQIFKLLDICPPLSMARHELSPRIGGCVTRLDCRQLGSGCFQCS